MYIEFSDLFLRIQTTLESITKPDKHLLLAVFTALYQKNMYYNCCTFYNSLPGNLQAETVLRILSSE